MVNSKRVNELKHSNTKGLTPLKVDIKKLIKNKVEGKMKDVEITVLSIEKVIPGIHGLYTLKLSLLIFKISMRNPYPEFRFNL